MSIYDEETVGPDELTISDRNANEQAIAAWFRRAMLYREAMSDLDRAVLLKRAEDGRVYLSSIPAGDDNV